MTDFEQIYREHFETVYRFLVRLSRNEPLAEELAQETFFRAMRSLGKFDGRCRVEVWLCQIAKNAYYSYCRKHKNRENSGRNFVLPPATEEMEANVAERDALMGRSSG